MTFIAPAKLIIAPAQLITAPAQLITAPAQHITAPTQLITAPAQPPATGAAVYTALFLIARYRRLKQIIFVPRLPPPSELEMGFMGRDYLSECPRLII